LRIFQIVLKVINTELKQQPVFTQGFYVQCQNFIQFDNYQHRQGYCWKYSSTEWRYKWDLPGLYLIIQVWSLLYCCQK